MYLLHSTNSEAKILKDGELKPSSVTKNIQLYGLSRGSPYVFLRLKIKNDSAPIILDYKLLLEHKFCLNVGWAAEPMTELIDGRQLTVTQLRSLLTDFKKKVIENYEKNKKETPLSFIMMSNEILVLGNIDLHKYLKTIRIRQPLQSNTRLLKYIEKHYPDVKMDIL